MKRGPDLYDRRTGEPRPVDVLVDWKDRPDEVMEQVHKALKQHGLQVVYHDTGGDCYAFTITKK